MFNNISNYEVKYRLSNCLDKWHPGSSCKIVKFSPVCQEKSVCRFECTRVDEERAIENGSAYSGSLNLHIIGTFMTKQV